MLTPFPAINQSSFAGGPSIYPFVQNLLLVIRGEGLVASLTMLLNNQEDDVKQLLAVPDDFSLAAHVGVGWPAQAHLTRLWRRLVEDFTSIDRFGRGRPTGAKGCEGVSAVPPSASRNQGMRSYAAIEVTVSLGYLQ